MLKDHGVHIFIFLCLLQYFHREVLDEYRQINQLGEASAFFNSFQWTDQAFRDIESVNLNGIHFIVCGSEVQDAYKHYATYSMHHTQYNACQNCIQVCKEGSSTHAYPIYRLD